MKRTATMNFNLTDVTGHGLSTIAIIGAILGYFPALAAVAAFIWYCIQIYQSQTVQLWLHTRRLRKVAKLKKELATLEAREKAEVHKLEVDGK